MSDDFPAFGQPDQADVGEQPQLELQPSLLPHLAALGESRGTPASRRQARVAAAAAPAAGGDEGRALVGEVGEHLPVGVADERAGRHRR